MAIKISGSLDQALNRLVSSNAQHVKVGVMENSTYPDGTKVATVAYKNEYGFKNIPSRPFFRDTIAEHKKAWGELAVKGARAGYTIEKILGLVGMQMTQDIQYTIITFTNPPNAPATIAKKGQNSPLRDSLLMHDSITYEVVDG